MIEYSDGRMSGLLHFLRMSNFHTADKQQAKHENGCFLVLCQIVITNLQLEGLRL